MARHQFSLPLVDSLNRSPLPEARLLHEAQAPGFFALLTKPSPADIEYDRRVYGKTRRRPRQSSYRIEHLPLVLDRLDPTCDSFLSQAQFFRPTRRVIHLWHINLCFVDLDVYKSDLAGQGLNDVVQTLRRYCGDEGVPLPSVIISSGRGLYAKWVLERPLPQAALPRWNAVQEALLGKFAPFHADWKARSASQVLRLVQTVNTKSGECVRVLHVEERDGEPLRYDFELLAEAVLPWTRQELEALRTRRALEKAGQRQLRLLRGGREGPARFSPAVWHGRGCRTCAPCRVCVGEWSRKDFGRRRCSGRCCSCWGVVSRRRGRCSTRPGPWRVSSTRTSCGITSGETVT